LRAGGEDDGCPQARGSVARPIDREERPLWAERVWRFEQSGLPGA